MAIAFDAAVDGGTVTATSLTYAHTTSGSNRSLVVGVAGSNAADNITGVTYAGVAMSLVQKIIFGSGGSARSLYCFLLIGPTVGANNVIVSASGSTFIGACSASYTGVGSGGQPNSSATAVNASTAIMNASTTPVADNCRVIGFFKNDLDAVIPPVGCVRRISAPGIGGGIGDPGSNTTPPALTTLSFTNTSVGATAWSAIMLSLSPATPNTQSMFLVF